jgi:hypothetical protein
LKKQLIFPAIKIKKAESTGNLNLLFSPNSIIDETAIVYTWMIRQKRQAILTAVGIDPSFLNRFIRVEV